VEIIRTTTPAEPNPALQAGTNFPDRYNCDSIKSVNHRLFISAAGKKVENSRIDRFVH
jgi:hypothetical protein